MNTVLIGALALAMQFATTLAFAQEVDGAPEDEIVIDPGDGYSPPEPVKQPDDSGREPICTLTDRDAEEAIAAFSRMMPALLDPRCSNCHGGVNPFSENGGHAGGQIKLGSIADRWLGDRKAIGDVLVSKSPTEVAKAETALRTILSAEGENLSSDAIAEILNAGGLEEAVAASACTSCHAHSPVAWRIAKSPFAGRTQQQLCEAFQLHPDVTSPAEFVEHISRDPLAFIPVAFSGTRALTPFGQAILKEQTGRDYAPEPVKGADATSLNRAAFEWASRLGRSYRRPASCGCEKMSYALVIETGLDVDFAESGSYAEMRQRHTFRLPMVFTEDGNFSADGKTTVSIDVAAGADGTNCSFSQPVEEEWALKGVIDKSVNELNLTGTVTTRSKPAEIICYAEGKVIRQAIPLPTEAAVVNPYNLSMPAYVNEEKKATLDLPNGARTLGVRIERK